MHAKKRTPERMVTHSSSLILKAAISQEIEFVLSSIRRGLVKDPDAAFGRVHLSFVPENDKKFVLRDTLN